MSTSLQLFAVNFLKRIREFVDSEKLVIERLPKWVRSASVKIAKLNDSNIFLFEDSPGDTDLFVDYGQVRSDLQFFLELPEYMPEGASFKAPSGRGLIILYGEYGESKRVVFNITSSNSALYNVGYIPYHSPLAIVNIFIQLSARGDVLAIRFVPFAIYVHDKDLVDFENFWDKCTPHLQDVLQAIHNSETGHYYQLTKDRKSGVLIGKERSVIVFGKDSDPEMLRELLRVRDYLVSKNYDAYLLRDLPEHPSMSLEEKVKLWSLASRFCVMIDREPSGHLVEYPYLKSVGAVLAVLRPKGTGSSYMIGAERSPDIKFFEFINSPLETLDTAITWAEKMIREKIKLYGKAYPWRK
jgi:hypothetical protein